MELREANKADCLLLMSWFEDKAALQIWSGPNVRYPLNQESFTEDIQLAKLDSYILEDEDNNLVAFGQFYERLGRCHLGRLVVNPIYRRQGFGELLIKKLGQKGQSTLGLKGLSLFVLKTNKVALALYRKMDFEITDYPEPLAIDGCLYLIKV